MFVSVQTVIEKKKKKKILPCYYLANLASCESLRSHQNVFQSSLKCLQLCPEVIRFEVNEVQALQMAIFIMYLLQFYEMQHTLNCIYYDEYDYVQEMALR